jgi:hypothetical protein
MFKPFFFFFSFKDIKAFANNFEKQKKSSKFNNFLPFKNNKVIGLKKVDWSNESLWKDSLQLQALANAFFSPF